LYLALLNGLCNNETTNIGYDRVSTFEQTLALQQDALAAAPCERVFTDTISGSKSERPGLTEALDFLRPGDVLVVWRLDRLGRNLKMLIETLTALAERGIGFRSLTEQIDTPPPGGKLIFHVFGALAEFERDLIRERTQAGLAAARARGRKGGRTRKLGTPGKVAMARSLYNDHTNSIEDICKTLGISRATLYRHLDSSTPRPQGMCIIAKWSEPLRANHGVRQLRAHCRCRLKFDGR